MISNKNRKLGIATKTSIISGVIVLILLCINSVLSINMQSNSSRLMIDDFTQFQSNDLEEYTTIQNQLIRENIKINLEICSNISESFIYNFDQDNLNLLLADFVKIDGIVAIKVHDADDQPFASTWEKEGIETGSSIPSDLDLKESFSFTRDAVHDGEKVGTVKIYYTDQMVSKEIADKKIKTEKRITEFSNIAKASINNSVKSQILVAICIIIALIFSIVLCLRFIVVNPINLITRGMTDGANQVGTASDQMSFSSQSLAETSSEQAASIEETSSSMEEMASMTKKNADNSNQADILMKEAYQVVKTANESMGNLTISMDDISKASDETSKIVKTIDEIAFQTNLLALNAAVEAARAGEAGAGFAVVADEVRNLAMRAADAAQNTAQLIESTVKKINLGTDLVSTTNDAFCQVEQSTTKVGDLVSEISEASKEQSEGIDQVNLAITKMDKIVQQNAVNAEESASASEEMSAQAEQLKNYIFELLLLIKGAKGGEKTRLASDKIKPAKLKKTHISDQRALASRSTEIGSDQILPYDNNDF